MADEAKSASKTNIFIAIAVVMIIAIVGFSGSGGFKITGFAAPQVGTATINLTSAVDITLIDANISFGAGAVTAGAYWAQIFSSNHSTVNGSWVPINDPLLLENTGNILANISAYISSSWASAIGGTGAIGWINYTNNETNSCLVQGNGNGVWYTGPGLSSNTTVLCNKLNFSDINDIIRIDVKLQIPSDSPPGDKSNQMTFSATASA